MNLSDSPLGKKVSYITSYTPSLLFPVPRKDNRAKIGITNQPPFEGVDIWNGYELSWLNTKGKPQVALAEFYFPCNSSNLVESKSFKLYLLSFNQTQFNSFDEVSYILEKDLSKACRKPVKVSLISPKEFKSQTIEEFEGICLDDLDLAIDRYDPHADYLKTSKGQSVETVYSHLLKSNCFITAQPDWASVQIHYEGPKINHDGLLRYLISFRNHLEFHEHCVERIYMDIWTRCKPKKLSVYARYTRRGGLDINPYRSNFASIPKNVRNCRQ